jgi:hypothetical protein
VLVCNGKDQYQARDDLEAFLGERTADFVSWYFLSLPPFFFFFFFFFFCILVNRRATSIC